MGVCTGFIVNPFLLVAIAFLAVILILLFRRRMEKGEAPALPMSAGETGKKSPSEPPAAKPAEVPAVVEEEVGGVPALREYSFSKLNYLSVAGCWQVHLQCRAAANRCQIGVDPAFARFVKVENSRDGLLIRYTGKKRPEEPMTIELSSTGVPAQVKAIGRNSIWIDSVEAPKFVCKITDGGKLEVPGAKVEELVVKLTGSCRAECGGEFGLAEIEVSGASNAKLRGSIRKLEARLSGASKAEAVQVEKAEIDVSGASKLKLEVTDKLEGDLSGGSSLKFRGEVDTSGIRISGSSRLKSWN